MTYQPFSTISFGPAQCNGLMTTGTWSGYADSFPANFPIERLRGRPCVAGRVHPINSTEAQSVIRFLEESSEAGELLHADASWSGSFLDIRF